MRTRTRFGRNRHCSTRSLVFIIGTSARLVPSLASWAARSWHPTIYDAGGVPGSAMLREESWSTSNSFWGTFSVQTTERYLGCKQRIRSVVNDRIGIEPNP